MKKVNNKLRVVHFPQVGSLKKSFKVDVLDEVQAFFIINLLSLQHLWLEKNNVIPDFSNVIFVEMLEDDGSGKEEWVDYWNEEEGMEWDEIEKTYLQNDESLKIFTVEHLNEINKK